MSNRLGFLSAHSTCVLLWLSISSSMLVAQTSPPANRTAYAMAIDSAFAWSINSASIAFTFPEKDLFAENVAYNPRDGSFFLGSTRHGKVLRRGPDGQIEEFISSGRDGLWMVIGMKVDTARGVLWVNSAAGSNFVRHRPADNGKSALFAYDLQSGRLRARFAPPDTGRHFFNDLVIAKDGRLFITDMFGGAVYSLAPDAFRRNATLEPWSLPGALDSPNGIALDASERTLFVATDRGIGRFDVASKAFALLPTAPDVEMRGIDGLYWHRSGLIGVQGGRVNRVQRFVLSADGSRIERGVTLEANHPLFMNPTTGVLVNDDLYIVANSQFSSIDARGVTLAPDRLFETVILRLPLRVR